MADGMYLSFGDAKRFSLQLACELLGEHEPDAIVEAASKFYAFLTDEA